jgi:hypothetical protein
MENKWTEIYGKTTGQLAQHFNNVYSEKRTGKILDFNCPNCGPTRVYQLWEEWDYYCNGCSHIIHSKNFPTIDYYFLVWDQDFIRKTCK